MIKMSQLIKMDLKYISKMIKISLILVSDIITIHQIQEPIYLNQMEILNQDPYNMLI
jgi:hypothetical protein